MGLDCELEVSLGTSPAVCYKRVAFSITVDYLRLKKDEVFTSFIHQFIKKTVRYAHVVKNVQFVRFVLSEEIMMSKYENQEALVLSAKRVQARLARADELGIGSLDFEGLKELVENLSLAKAIQTGKAVELCRRGQEFYVQTLIDATTKSVGELVDAEYRAATLELGSEDEIMSMLESMQSNLS